MGEGRTEEEQARSVLLADTLTDYIQALTGLSYNPGFSADLLASFASGLAPRLTLLETFLAKSSGQWCAGSSLTWVDNFMTRFAALPQVAAYLDRPTYRPFPIWSVRAKYGYKPPTSA